MDPPRSGSIRAEVGRRWGRQRRGWWKVEWNVGRSPITVRAVAHDRPHEAGMLRAPHTVVTALMGAAVGWRGLTRELGKT